MSLVQVLALCLLLCALLAPGLARAQDDVLLGNSGQAEGAAQPAGFNLRDYAQGFTTGSAANGYIVTSVEIRFADVSATDALPRVSIVAAEANLPTGALVGTFAAPASLTADSVATFTASGVQLDPETVYFLVVEGAGEMNNLSLTDSPTARAQAGWAFGPMAARSRTSNIPRWRPFRINNGNRIRLDFKGGVSPTDVVAPRVTSITRQSPLTSPTRADSLTWRVTFSEAVQAVTAADFTVEGTDATLSVSEVMGATGVWDVTASGGDLAGLNGAVTLRFAEMQDITDTAATPNRLTNTTPTGAHDPAYMLDNTAPTLMITDVPVTSDGPFTATITFSEAVTGFTQSDIMVTNAALSAVTETVTGTTWTVLVTPTTDGEVTLDIAAGVATDAADNGNTAAPQAMSRYMAPAPPAPPAADGTLWAAVRSRFRKVPLAWSAAEGGSGAISAATTSARMRLTLRLGPMPSPGSA